MVSRRNFLQLGGIAMAGGLVLGPSISVFGQAAGNSPYFPIPADVYSDKAVSLNRQMFDPLLNSTFSFSKTTANEDLLAGGREGRPFSLRLVEIVGDDGTKRSRSARPVDSFSLIFEETRQSRVDDNIYTVSHPELGTFSMFISTVGRSESRYQAVFNRIYM